MCLCVLSWWHVDCDVGLHWNVLVHYGLAPRPVACVGSPASFPDHGGGLGLGQHIASLVAGVVFRTLMPVIISLRLI